MQVIEDDGEVERIVLKGQGRTGLEVQHPPLHPRLVLAHETDRLRRPIHRHHLPPVSRQPDRVAAGAAGEVESAAGGDVGDCLDEQFCRLGVELVVLAGLLTGGAVACIPVLEAHVPYNTRVSVKGILQTIFRGEGRMLQPGEQAPDFDVVDHNGNQVRLSDLRGQKVVLWFYPKADTPG